MIHNNEFRSLLLIALYIEILLSWLIINNNKNILYYLLIILVDIFLFNCINFYYYYIVKVYYIDNCTISCTFNYERWAFT